MFQYSENLEKAIVKAKHDKTFVSEILNLVAEDSSGDFQREKVRRAFFL